LALLLGLLACNQLDSPEAREVVEVTQHTVERGVDKAKEVIDSVDMDKVRRTWDAALGAIRSIGSDEAETNKPEPVDPLAGAAEAITCDEAKERCTVTAAFMARAREHSVRVAQQVRVSPVYGEVRGIRIDEMDLGSIARRVGLQTGDIITHVNQIPLGSVQDAMFLYLRIRTAQSFTVDYRRGEAERVLVIDVV
jgi:hypothetical protein